MFAAAARNQDDGLETVRFFLDVPQREMAVATKIGMAAISSNSKSRTGMMVLILDQPVNRI
jgi:hypothetical protein